MKAMLLAAGKGERMRPLTDTTPKPLLRVGGKPLIERHLERLSAAGVHEVVINLGWHGTQLRSALGDGSRWGLRIRYSEEGWPALETGGGIFRALPLLGREPFMVISSDIWSEFPIGELIARGRSLRTHDLAHLVLVPKPGFPPDFRVENGRARNDAPEFTFGNYCVLRPELFHGHRDGAFPVGPLWHQAADADRVSGEVYRGEWWNLGTPQQLAMLDEKLKQISP